MARPKSNNSPKYRLHKPSGKAVVRINGKDHYLGKYGTPASRREYKRLIANLWATDDAPKPVAPKPYQTVTVAFLAVASAEHSPTPAV